MNSSDKLKQLEIKMGILQRELRERQIPAIIIFEGLSAAGRGRLISELINIFDSRSYNVITKSLLAESAVERPKLQKFWLNTPEKGRIAIFERSPYAEIIRKASDDKKFKTDLSHVLAFERTFLAEGNLVLKIFLDVSEKEQKRRLKKLEKNKNSRWRVSDDDWKQHDNYRKYSKAITTILEKSSNQTKWVRINSDDLKSAKINLFEIIVGFLENKLKKTSKVAKIAKAITLPNINFSPTDQLDLSLSISRDAYEENLKKLQKELLELEFRIYRKRVPVIIAFEGCDAAGKGGAIRRLTQGLDPRGFEVIPIAAPDGIEKRHHYLWRFWRKFPKAGHFAIFDRTWYGRVLVERVEKFCTKHDWTRAYAEINDMEEYLAKDGAIICKFWLHISQEEQLKRFNDRQNVDWKKWKITDEDWRNREKWTEYKRAIDEMLVRTNTEHAPWTIVEAESKLFSRIKILSTVVNRLREI